VKLKDLFINIIGYCYKKKIIFILILSGILVVLINVALVITASEVRIPPLSL
jgi:hypothetical protein